MSIWDVLTGDASDQTDRINNAGDRARRTLTRGVGRTPGGSAQGSLGRGRDIIRDRYHGAIDNTRAGGRNAIGAINTGQGQALGANDQALGAVQGGYGQAANTVRGGTTAATGRLDPYAQTGQSANAMFANAIGANGQAAQQQYVDQYQADPSQQFAQQAIERRMNARGMLDSGAAAAAAARAHLEGYNQRLGMLQSAGQQGQQAAGQQGNWDFAGGQSVAGYEQGQGAAEAGLYGDRANIYSGGAANRANIHQNTANNVAGILQNQGQLENQSYGRAADYGVGLSSALASESIDRANAVNQAQANAQNAMLDTWGNIIGTVTSGFTPNANGQSTFGHMSNMMFG